MRRFCAVLLCAVTMFAVTELQAAPEAEFRLDSPRALWVWKIDPVNRKNGREKLLAFCERTAIRRIYLYFHQKPYDSWTPAYKARLASFLQEAHDLGIEVHALQGDPNWALEKHHKRVLNWVDCFLAYNKEHPEEQRIDGIQLDIEPYLSPIWNTDKQPIIKRDFVKLMQKVRKHIDRETKDFTRPWVLGPLKERAFVSGLAIPVFFKDDPVFIGQLLDTIDYVALMAYYDTDKDIIQRSQLHLDLAKQAGVQVTIGIETQDLIKMKQGSRRNTFLEEGWEAMEEALHKVADHFAGHAAFDGVAIHTYYSYLTLSKERNVPLRERSGKVPSLVAKAIEAPLALDGKLSDWDGVEWIEHGARKHVVHGKVGWEGPTDFSYRVAVKWEPEALWLAMDVNDNAVIQKMQAEELWQGDHFEVWIDAILHHDYKEAINSLDDFQIGLSPGNFKDIEPEAYVWVPSETKAPDTLNLAAQRTPTGYTMEARIPVTLLFENIVQTDGAQSVATKAGIEELLALEKMVLQEGRLRPGFQLGLMIDGSDTDHTDRPQKTLMSTSGERQWGDPTTFNRIELI